MKTETLPNQTLNIQTLAGNSEQNSVVTSKLVISDSISLDIFVIDTNLKLDQQQIEVRKTWPSLDPNLLKQATKNMIHGKIDVVIGIYQLYTKVSSAKTISHPIKGLVLLDNIFGWSPGGSTLKRKNLM